MENKITTSTIVAVTNRTNGTVSYKLNNGLYRTFSVRETKKIDLEELKELKATEGGEAILNQCLLINDHSALDALNVNTEPEYFYTEEDITKLLLEGSVDQLEDCLNFAPMGVIELIKSIGLKIQVPDTRKRKLIFEKTGYSIDNAIKVNEILEEEKSQENTEPTIQRKAAPIKTDNTETTSDKPVRKYNISKKD